MELIQTVFDQLHADINAKLASVEKQVLMILAQSNHTAPVPEDFLKIKETMNSLNTRLGRMEYRLQTLEASKQSPQLSPIPTTAGLEGLLLKSINLPSPVLRASQNVVHPILQKSIDIVEPDEDALQGELAAQSAGLNIVQEEDEIVEEEKVEEEEEEDEEVEEEVVEEEDVEEEEEEVVEEVEEEEEDQEVQLEEWLWKGKTYYKSSDNKVYRTNEDGDIEDDPFAEYIPTPAPGRLVRI
jgi:hypothetical protein